MFVPAVFIFIFSLSEAVFAADSVKIVINKKINKLAYIRNGVAVKIFPVATGRKPSFTPEGVFRVVRKAVNPYYHKKKIPGGSPRNPLGVRWLGLDALGTSGGTYGIHGTSNPRSIGKYASAGCIRMYNQDVIWLYSNTPANTVVEIINKPWELEQRPVSIVVDGRPLIEEKEARAYLTGGIVMAPCRPVAESMGCSLKWEEVRKKVTIESPGTAMSMTSGSAVIYRNGNESRMEVPADLRNGRVYIHIRALAEAFGYSLNWDGNSSTVSLQKGA